MRNIVILIVSKYYSFLVNIRTQKKIKKIFSNIESKNLFHKPDQKYLKNHIKKWSKFDKKISPLWYKVFSSLTNNPDENYIPENIFYSKVEPVLNNKIFAMAYRDKNSYDLIFKSSFFPKVYIRNIDGLFLGFNYNKINDIKKYFQTLLFKTPLIIKPSFNTGGGYKIKLLKAIGNNFVDQNNMITDLNSLQKEYVRNYIVQEYIKQHEFTSQFNKSSLNTFRLLTYRSVESNKIYLLQSVFRIGQKGKITDNQASGGIAVGINANGLISDYGVDKFGNKYYSSNNINFKSAGMIPKFGLMKELVLKLSEKLIYSRLIGWDICIDKNENIRILELNNIFNEINFFQMTNGPLFSEFTDEVIEYCRLSPGTFSANYYFEK